MIFPTYFDHLEESLNSYKEVHFNKFCSPAKTGYPPIENVNDTPEYDSNVLTAAIRNVNLLHLKGGPWMMLLTEVC